MVDQGMEVGVEQIVIGMPHRGRLNVLCNVVNKPLQVVFNEFAGIKDDEEEGSGDVKYHLGMTGSVSHPRDASKQIKLSLMANPSHLEAVNTVVEGKTRAEQDFSGDTDGKRVLPVLLHGDAAFAGQGIVFETFGLSALPGYRTGGTIHVVVNNQIGFTTDPADSRSSPYCTDVAKTVNAPIFHVNGDDVEAVVNCFEIALEWRQKFGRDVVIDIVSYRRHGHNETDEPEFTQPRMYHAVKAHPYLVDVYSKQLISEGVMTAEEIEVGLFFVPVWVAWHCVGWRGH